MRDGTRRLALGLLLTAALAAPALGAARADTPPPAPRLARIEVAPDHWTFREARSHRAFVPFGTNYTPAWSGWSPDYVSAERFDRGRIAADFARMQSLGVNICKAVFPLRRILPDPQTPDRVTLDSGCLDRIDQITDIAGQHGIRLLWTLSPDWNGFPDWFTRNGSFFGAANQAILARFWGQFASHFRGDGRVFGYSFDVETELGGWGSPVTLPQWQDWARAKYSTLAAANRAWNSGYARWEDVPAAGHDGSNAPDWAKHPEGTAENQNHAGDPFLYDYVLFREWAAFRYMHAQAAAVKRADPQALCTMGFVQWNPLLRQWWAPNNDGPGVGPEYNTREMAKTFDFVAIHFYPVYPNGNDETQMRYLELWARWAWAGKPVVLEEFNEPPADKNVAWCSQLIPRSRRFLSGWLVWTFQDTPHSDSVTEVCGLLDEQGNVTPWGRAFAALAPAVEAWRLKRQPPARRVPVDKRFLFTSGRYREILDGLIHADTQAVDFSLESNASIDRLLQEKSAPETVP